MLDSGFCVPAGVSVSRKDFADIGYFSQAKMPTLLKEELSLAKDQASAVSSARNILS